MLVKIWGGLGNQMFQYAFAKALAKRMQAPAFLDCRDFFQENVFVTNRDFKLAAFNIKLPIATDLQVKGVFPFRKIKTLHRIERKLIKHLPLCFRSYVFEDSFVFSRANIRKARYYEGYWQSYRYFDFMKEEIIQDLTLKIVPTYSAFNEQVERIKGSQSVSIHIRRGDYINNAAVLAHHGVLGLEYYEKALDLIKSRIENPTFFIFSDDLAWVKENMFKGLSAVYVDGNSPELDLHLMALCKHNIIANSTFSWWAAYMNTNRNKLVFAPSKWFNIDVDTSTLIPEEWIRL